MSTIGLPLNIGALPYTCYPSDPQTFYADMFSRARALFPAITGVVISSGTPAASDRDKLWIKTSGGAPTQPQPQYIYFNGVWVWPNVAPAGGNKRELWAGSLVDLVTYDGGDANLVGDASGAMWEEDTTFQGRIPMGPGAISGSDPAKTLALNEQYGEGSVTLTDAQLFYAQSHKHVMGRINTGDNGAFTFESTSEPFTGAGSLQGRLISGEGGAATYALSDSTLNGPYLVTSETYNPATGLAVSATANVAHENVPPVVGIYIIKRTSRVYYKG
jgi:microcystin-dependent protein